MEFTGIMSNAFRLKDSMIRCVFMANHFMAWPAVAAVFVYLQMRAAPLNITILNLCYRKIEFRIH